MKPFNLERALAGEPVITGDGFPVSRVTYFPEVSGEYKVGCVVKGELRTFSVDGVFHTNYGHVSNNLFMASVKKNGWIGITKHDRQYTTGAVYPTKERLEEIVGNEQYHFIEIEWDE